MNATRATNAGNGSTRKKKAASDALESPERREIVRVVEAEIRAMESLPLSADCDAATCTSCPGERVFNVAFDDGVHVNAAVPPAVESELLLLLLFD